MEGEVLAPCVVVRRGLLARVGMLIWTPRRRMIAREGLPSGADNGLRPCLRRKPARFWLY